MISAEWWSLKSKCNELNKEWVGVKELEMKTRILAMKIWEVGYPNAVTNLCFP